MALVKCPDCAREVSDQAPACPACGRPMGAASIAQLSGHGPGAPPPLPHPGAAAVLSLVIPGAGQMYSGRVGVGLIFLLATVVGYLLLFIPGLVLHLISILEAASWASRRRERG